MRGEKDQTLDMLQKAIALSPSDETEAVFLGHDYGLTRFAANVVHQNMSEEDGILAVRVARNQRLGACATNRLDEEGIRRAVRRASEIADLSQPIPHFAGFASPQPLPAIGGEVFIESTAKAGAKERAQKTATLLGEVSERGFEAAGAISNGVYVTAVATSRGQTAYQIETRSSANTVVNRPGEAGFGTGYAQWHGRNLDLFDSRNLAREAAILSARNVDAQPLEPGEYTVVLTPEAASTLLFYLSWMGFHARAVESRQSFLMDKWGQTVLDENVSIWDDGLNDLNYAIPFDWEGKPKRKVEIIQQGKAVGVVYDSITATRNRCGSTGHALSPVRDRYYSSPLPEHLCMEAGQATLDEMIASTERGLFINRFWYVREVHFGRTIVTGMTRDGTFLIENGRLTQATRNLRFTDSISHAFGEVPMVGRDLKLCDLYVGTALVPALKLGRLKITGVSSF